MADEVEKAEAVKAPAPVAKIDAAAEKAYAEAAAKATEAAKPAAAQKAAAPVEKPAAAKPVAKKVAAAKSAKTKIGTKLASKVAAANKAIVKKPVKAAKPVPAPAVAATTASNPIAKLKDKIMETANTTDFTAAAKDMAADLQTRVQGVYAKTAEMASEAAEFSKGNVEAVVESGKIFFTGAQELVRDNLETGKTVLETVTADAKKMMEVKSPTELMQMQGELARRNFDAIVSFGSQRTEAWLKLYNDAFAPISNRVSIAAEKVTKAA